MCISRLSVKTTFNHISRINIIQILINVNKNKGNKAIIHAPKTLYK